VPQPDLPPPSSETFFVHSSSHLSFPVVSIPPKNAQIYALPHRKTNTRDNKRSEGIEQKLAEYVLVSQNRRPFERIGLFHARSHIAPGGVIGDNIAAANIPAFT